jgi:hypothetical protein
LCGADKWTSVSPWEEAVAAAGGVGLRRVAEMAAMRETAIAEYRALRGRPMVRRCMLNL